MKLVIDYREKSLKDLFDSNEDTSSQIFYENLDIGDVHLAYNSTDLNAPLIQVILERKTLNDLACSIKDGRYREQKMRLLKYREDNPHIKILYILEGHYHKKTRPKLTSIFGLRNVQVCVDDVFLNTDITSNQNEQIIKKIRLFLPLAKIEISTY